MKNRLLGARTAKNAFRSGSESDSKPAFPDPPPGPPGGRGLRPRTKLKIVLSTDRHTCPKRILCYAIVLPGRKSGFRGGISAGFIPPPPLLPFPTPSPPFISPIYGCGLRSCGCILRLSDVRSGSFGVDLGSVSSHLGPKPVPNRPRMYFGKLQIATR